MKTKHILIVIGFVCLALVSSAFGVKEFVLVRDGQSKFCIFREDGAPSSVLLAAEELRSYILKATGAELPIVGKPASPMICLGDCPAARAAGLSSEGLGQEAFRIITRGENLYIFGHGTLFGAYTFLEKVVGIRWLMPGEAGEDVPKAKSLILPEMSLIDAPDFLRRRIPYIQNSNPEVQRWSLRNKLGESLSLSHGHNWRRTIPASFFDKHPDYFAMRNGKRMPPVGRYKLCTTNPGLIRAYADAAVAAFKKNPRRQAYSLSPSDSAGWCECPRCTALDELDPNGKLSHTRRILTFYNEVAKLVAQRFPDRIVCGYVYASYVFPPRDRAMKLAPNLFLVWAPSFDYGFTLFRPELRKQWERVLTEWTSMTQNIAYYDLPVKLEQDLGAPNPPGIKILKHIFPRLKKRGIKGLYIYGVGAWGHGGLVNYLLAKLSWDAEADVDALFNEFCERAYGRGANAMKQIYHLLDAEMERHYRANPEARYKLTPSILKDVYARNFTRIERLHQKALAQAVSPAVRARLEMFGDNLKILLCFGLDANGLLENAKDSAYYLPPERFEAFLTKRADSLALTPKPVHRLHTKPLDITVFKANVATAEPIRRYMLRGANDVILYPLSNGCVEVEFTTLIPRGRLLWYTLYDRNGKILKTGIARKGHKVAFNARGRSYYHLYIDHGKDASYAIETAVPFAIDATGSNGLHFQGHATPVYFHVAEGTHSFGLTLSSSAPGETAVAKLYNPRDELVATLRTVEVPADRQTIQVAEGNSGVWKVVFEKAQAGYFDDVYLQPGSELSGFFSLSGQTVLQIRHPAKR